MCVSCMRELCLFLAGCITTLILCQIKMKFIYLIPLIFQYHTAVIFYIFCIEN